MFKPAAVKPAHGRHVAARYHMEEVQKVDKPEEYRIEKLLNTGRINNKKEYLVKWVGYPNKFNEWVGEDQTHRL